MHGPVEEAKLSSEKVVPSAKAEKVGVWVVVVARRVVFWGGARMDVRAIQRSSVRRAVGAKSAMATEAVSVDG